MSNIFPLPTKKEKKKKEKFSPKYKLLGLGVPLVELGLE